MSLLVPPADAVQDWSPSNGCESPDPGTSPPLHDRLQHLSLRKKTSYRYCDVIPHTCTVDRWVFMTTLRRYVNQSISQMFFMSSARRRRFVSRAAAFSTDCPDLYVTKPPSIDIYCKVQVNDFAQAVLNNFYFYFRVIIVSDVTTLCLRKKRRPIYIYDNLVRRHPILSVLCRNCPQGI